MQDIQAIYSQALKWCVAVFPAWKDLTLSDLDIVNASGLTNMTLLIRRKGATRFPRDHFTQGNPIHADFPYPPFFNSPHSNFFLEQSVKHNINGVPVKENTQLTNAAVVYADVRDAGKQFQDPKDISKNPHGLVVRIFNNPITKYNVPCEHIYYEVLSKQGIGPRCYFQNDEYRVEQLLQCRNSTLWEMRNPTFMRTAIRKICDLHNNLELEQRIKEKLGGKKPMMEWNELKEKWIKPYQKIRDLVLSGDRDYIPQYIKAVKTYEFILKPEFQEEFENLLPQNAKLVISHNDIQECNFMVHHQDTRRITIIDFDYVGFNYRAFDLAGYVNECQLDNNHQGDFPYIAYYRENAMSYEEEVSVVKIYLEREWEIKKAREKYFKQRLQKEEEQKGEQNNAPIQDQVSERDVYIEANFAQLMQQLKSMIALGHLFWGIWALATVPVERRDQKVFNYHYSLARYDGYLKTKP